MTIHDLVKQAVSHEANNWVLPILWGIARLCENGVFGQIGFQNGTSALALLIAAAEANGHVYSMDIRECEEGQERVEREGYADRHTFIHADSAAASFPEQLDLLFIDGGHYYNDVAIDYERHRGSVNKNGVILFHDPITAPGVARFLREQKIPYFELGSGLGMEVVRG